jgi:serine/threonine-protein kinase
MRRSDCWEGGIVADKYRLLRTIGSGGMGTVYEGLHVEIGKRVAVKIIHPSFATDAEAFARFYREARVAARIESDYIVQCFDVGDDPTYGLYMIIEYLEGEDLENRLRRDTRLDVPTAVAVGYQVARGLAKAHAAGVVHRDLKPANLFLTSRRDDDALLVKVLDFGVSMLRESDEGKNDRLTDPAITLGTPHYMSPEQVEGGVKLDARADLWSLAALLYETLSGAPPFGAGEYFDVLTRILRSRARRLCEVAPWVPRRISDVIHEGLTRDREHRIADAETFARRLVEACPGEARPVSGNYSLGKTKIPTTVPTLAAARSRRGR